MTPILKIIRIFREPTGLYYHCDLKQPAKYGDLVTLEDDFESYDAFGVLTQKHGQLVIDMGHKYFVITDEVKEDILAGSVERFYFKGIRLEEI